MNNTNSLLDYYEQKAANLNQEIKTLKTTINSYSLARLGFFLLGILAVYFFFSYGATAAITIGITVLIVFLILVKVQLKKQAVLDFKNVKLNLIINELNVISGKNNVYDNGNDYLSQEHVYSSDLDIFGEKSLFAYVNRSASSKAVAILANWFGYAANKIDILNRQESVKELEELVEETIDFRTRLFPLAKNQFNNIDSFISVKLSNMLSFLNKKSLQIFIQIIPFITCGLLVSAIFLGGVWWSIYALSLIISGVGYVLFKKEIDYAHEMVGRTTSILFNYSENLKWIETKAWKTSYLKQRVLEIKNDNPVYVQINELAKIIKDLDYRANPIIGTFLNLMFQWDLRCLLKLGKWQKKYNTNIVKSFDLMAEFEALISLSVLSFNHSDWTLPVIKDNFGFAAKDLGHPLITKSKRINNSFKLENHATVDVITGSNMAGKSTFLRTVGINMVLAFAGAKVCANYFETSIFNLLSYMRIKDSLTDDTSTFKAEINRLKMILDCTAKDKCSFVLIDEMLRGTNSKDKYLGSKVFIKKLIAQDTPGFIATHDLQIAELESEFPDNVRNYHFDIQVDNNEMYFDYLIKTGECKTFNASMLLKAIGLDVNE